MASYHGSVLSLVVCKWNLALIATTVRINVVLKIPYRSWQLMIGIFDWIEALPFSLNIPFLFYPLDLAELIEHFISWFCGYSFWLLYFSLTPWTLQFFAFISLIKMSFQFLFLFRIFHLKKVRIIVNDFFSWFFQWLLSRISFIRSYCG